MKMYIFSIKKYMGEMKIHFLLFFPLFFLFFLQSRSQQLRDKGIRADRKCTVKKTKKKTTTTTTSKRHYFQHFHENEVHLIQIQISKCILNNMTFGVDMWTSILASKKWLVKLSLITI